MQRSLHQNSDSRRVMMFMLEVCWARDPPREVLGLKAYISTKSDLKTPHFVGVERELVNES